MYNSFAVVFEYFLNIAFNTVPTTNLYHILSWISGFLFASNFYLQILQLICVILAILCFLCRPSCLSLFSGTSSATGRFFALAAAVASNEDSVAWSSIYGYIRHLKNSPKVHLADGATAITKAIDNVFGLENCVRNMYWPHV